jgi:hypothetical protein
VNREDELRALRSDLATGLDALDALSSKLRAGLEMLDDVLARPHAVYQQQNSTPKCGNPQCNGWVGSHPETGIPIPCIECRPHLAKPAAVNDSDPAGWKRRPHEETHPAR